MGRLVTYRTVHGLTRHAAHFCAAFWTLHRLGLPPSCARTLSRASMHRAHAAHSAIML